MLWRWSPKKRRTDGRTDGMEVMNLGKRRDSQRIRRGRRLSEESQRRTAGRTSANCPTPARNNKTKWEEQALEAIFVIAVVCRLFLLLFFFCFRFQHSLAPAARPPPPKKKREKRKKRTLTRWRPPGPNRAQTWGAENLGGVLARAGG